MDLSKNFDELSEDELESIILAAKDELTVRQKRLKQKGIIKIKEIAASIGVEVKILPLPKRDKKVSIKYRDPANPTNLWTGRGPIPRWLNAYLNNGFSIESFKV
jgi:DNA-binding protein H-NS